MEHRRSSAFNYFWDTLLEIDWSDSDSDLDLLEQVNLARNDFVHNVYLMTAETFQSEYHYEKYPDSAFVDPLWKAVLPSNRRLVVTKEAISSTVGQLHKLCSFLEDQRPQLLARLQ